MDRAGKRDKASRRGEGQVAPAALALDYFAPEPALQPYVTTLYSLTYSEREMRDVLPAGGGFLQVWVSGSGELEYPDGRREGPFKVTMICPSTAASQAHITGPALAVGAALSPLGWAALTGLSAGEHGDRVYDGAELFGPELAALAERMTKDHAAGKLNVAEIAQALAGFVAARLGPVNSRHAQLIGHVADWLSSSFDPPLSDLERRAAYSGRQLQRLVERYFGVSPKQLVRKYRVLRVAALLQSPETSDEQVAGLINLFYDQSHLIREMRHYMGRTPARLKGGNDPLLAAATGLRNYTEVTPNFARIPKN